MQTIVLATDGSPTAQKAMGTAIELAKATGWQLRVVTVWTTPVYGSGYTLSSYEPELIEAARDHAVHVAEAAVEAARSAGVQATSELRRGNVVREICDAAEETAADVIVLGAHGWGPLKRLAFGGVSSAVLHHAPAPVLVVRGGDEEAERELVGAARAASS